MPGPMPYYLEKGPAFEILEDFINTPGTRLVDALAKLRAKNPDGSYTHRFVDCGAFDSPALEFNQPLEDGTVRHWTIESWKQHINRHWFGIRDGADQPVDPAAATSLDEAESWWINYFGEDIEGVLRETIIRALETAYRIPHGEPLPRVGKSFDPWPIELFWKCGQAWFEGWISWRKLPGAQDRGLVTAMLCTPSEDTGNHYVWWSPVPPVGDSAGRSDPYDLGVDHLGQHWAGSVVVTHLHNRPVRRRAGHTPMRSRGQIVPPPPGAIYRGTGPVTAVRPAEVRGGVASQPRVWVP